MNNKRGNLKNLSDLYSWKLVERIAVLGSMNKAAEEAELDVSSVSNKVKRLESALGYELFARLPHNCVLTAKGELALKIFSPLLAEYSSRINRIISNESEKKSLKVNVANGLIPFMIQLLGEFKTLYYPDAEFELTDNKSQDLGHQLGFDIAIFANYGQKPPGHCSDLGVVPTVMVASTGYLRERPIRKPEDLSSHTLISCYNWNCGQRMLYCPDGSSVALTWNTLFGVDTNQSALCAVRNGIGVAWGIPLHLCTDGFKNGSLTRVFPDCESVALHFFLGQSTAPTTKIASDFIWFLRTKWKEKFAGMPAFAPCYALR